MTVRVICLRHASVRMAMFWPRIIVTDDQPKIIARLAEWIDDPAIDVVVATVEPASPGAM